MKIILINNPSDGPECYKIQAEDGRSVLIQTDWDYPGVATTFGWNIRKVQIEGRKLPPCLHSQTDGTVACSICGMSASAFIISASEWLDERDGAEAEDPGYFE